MSAMAMPWPFGEQPQGQQSPWNWITRGADRVDEGGDSDDGRGDPRGRRGRGGPYGGRGGRGGHRGEGRGTDPREVLRAAMGRSGHRGGDPRGGHGGPPPPPPHGGPPPPPQPHFGGPFGPGGPWGPDGPWGGGGPFGPGGNPFEAFFSGGGRRGHRHGGRRVRRGGVRMAILALLAEEPRSGYEIIREGKARSRGRWNPSPGSVYPMLQQLEDEGLVRPAESADDARRRPYELTDEGRAYVDANPEEAVLPWEAENEQEEAAYSPYAEMAGVAAQLAAAAVQVTQAGTPDQIERAKNLLAETRRGLYRILAEDDPAVDTDGGATEDDEDDDARGDGPVG